MGDVIQFDDDDDFGIGSDDEGAPAVAQGNNLGADSKQQVTALEEEELEDDDLYGDMQLGGIEQYEEEEEEELHEELYQEELSHDPRQAGYQRQPASALHQAGTHTGPPLTASQTAASLNLNPQAHSSGGAVRPTTGLRNEGGGPATRVPSGSDGLRGGAPSVLPAAAPPSTQALVPAASAPPASATSLADAYRARHVAGASAAGAAGGGNLNPLSTATPAEALQETCLYIGNLAWWTTDAQIETMVSQFGVIKTIKIYEDKSNGKSKGYCLVEFGSEGCARACVAGLSGRQVNDKPIIAVLATPQSLKKIQDAKKVKPAPAPAPAPAQNPKSTRKGAVVSVAPVAGVTAPKAAAKTVPPPPPAAAAAATTSPIIGEVQGIRRPAHGEAPGIAGAVGTYPGEPGGRGGRGMGYAGGRGPMPQVYDMQRSAPLFHMYYEGMYPPYSEGTYSYYSEGGYPFPQSGMYGRGRYGNPHARGMGPPRFAYHGPRGWDVATMHLCPTRSDRGARPEDHSQEDPPSSGDSASMSSSEDECRRNRSRSSGKRAKNQSDRLRPRRTTNEERYNERPRERR